YNTASDCEVILALYEEHGADFLEKLNGIFAFALYDAKKDVFLIARDHLGIIPLYMGRDAFGTLYVASELKALEGKCQEIQSFPPGHYLYSEIGLKPQPWYQREWTSYEAVEHAETSIDGLRQALEAAVERQLMADVPFGVLLSGGLDSSVVAAVTKRHVDRMG